MKIENSTLVYFGDEYTNKLAATHSNNGDLYLNDNFINNGSTASISGTTLFKSTINAIQTISGITTTVNFFNLTVDNSLIGVSVADGFGLLVENAVNLTAGDLRLVGEAQLVQNHVGININSSISGKLLKDQQGLNSIYGYNYWSTPVNNGGVFSLNGGLFDGTDASLNSFTAQQILFNLGSPYNGLPAVTDGSGNVLTPLTINTRWLNTYSASSGGYAGWNKIDENTNLLPGIGFLMKGTNTLSSSQNYVFKGTPNDGEFLFPINSGQSLLLGNPYPSALDSGKFISDNLALLDGALYFWVEGGSTSHILSDYLGGYATRNLTAGSLPSIASELIAGLGNSNTVTPPTQYMAVGQGFFVKVTETGTIRFDNSQRVFKTEDSGDSNFYKTASTQSKNNSTKSIVRIGYEDPEGFHRQIVLGFMPDSPADLNYNKGYDAIMYGVREDELFYIIEEDLNKKYVIQGVGAYNNLLEFPLGLIIAEEGNHKIMLDGLENFNDVVYIRDKILNTIYNLSESSFNPNLPPGEYFDRYSVVFEDQSTLDIPMFHLKDFNVYFDKNKSVIVNNVKSINIESISIFNMRGQQLVKIDDNSINQPEIIIPFNHETGMYLVLIETDQGVVTYKIIN